MAVRISDLIRVCRQILIVILQALLVVWAACAPLVWILRDGLGPDMVESGWMRGIFKFLVGWGVPALVLAVPLIWLSLDRVKVAVDRHKTPASGRVLKKPD